MTYWAQMLWVAIGGAAGAMMRFTVVRTVAGQWGDKPLPWGTLSVNFLGSFAFGLCFILFSQKFNMNEVFRLTVLVGFLGSFTTFSAFSFEVMRLLQSNQIGWALTYILSSVTLCVLGLWLAGIVTERLV